jgi:nucleolysin TIA-1/TIAR
MSKLGFLPFFLYFSPEIDTETLRNAFAPFGEISDCRVVKDMATNKSKGYGFCSFVKKTDAQSAIDTMNGQWLGSRSIRTNWATRKPPAPHNGYAAIGDKNKLEYDDMFNRSSATNFTVYCGGISDSDEDSIRRVFCQNGRIMEIRYFKDKGYAFIRYDNKESACSAIVAAHCTDIDGQNVKCSWGKENPGSSNPTNMPMNQVVSNVNTSNPSNGALTSRLGIPGQNPGAGSVMMPGANPAASGGYQGAVTWDPQQMQAAQLAAAAAQNPAAAQQYYAQQQYYAYMYSPQYMQMQQQQQAAAQQQYYAQQQQAAAGYPPGANSNNQGGQPQYPAGYGPPQSH